MRCRNGRIGLVTATKGGEHSFFVGWARVWPPAIAIGTSHRTREAHASAPRLASPDDAWHGAAIVFSLIAHCARAHSPSKDGRKTPLWPTLVWGVSRGNCGREANSSFFLPARLERVG